MQVFQVFIFIVIILPCLHSFQVNTWHRKLCISGARSSSSLHLPFTQHEVSSTIRKSSLSTTTLASTQIPTDLSSIDPKSMQLMQVMTLWLVMYPTLAVHAATDANTVNTLTIVKPTIDIFINSMSFFFLCRTVLSWYPKTDLKKFPFNVITWPTEPLLQPVRDLIPPAFGVDISAIIWVMLLSFMREILTGQQGILTLVEKS